MYLSLIKRKMKTILSLFRILLCLSQDFSNFNFDMLNTYWTRPSPTSSLLCPDKVIMGKAKLSPILFCTGSFNWMLDEVKSSKCFIIPRKLNKLWKRLVSTKVTLT